MRSNFLKSGFVFVLSMASSSFSPIFSSTCLLRMIFARLRPLLSIISKSNARLYTLLPSLKISPYCRTPFTFAGLSLNFSTPNNSISSWLLHFSTNFTPHIDLIAFSVFTSPSHSASDTMSHFCTILPSLHNSD